MLRRDKFFALKLVVPAILIIFLGTWATFLKITAEVRTETGHSLSTLLQTEHEAVRTWFREKRLNTLVLAKTEKLKGLSEKMLAVPTTKQALLSSPAQADLRRWLQPVLTSLGYRGFFLIGPGNISLGSSRDQNVGSVNLLAKQEGFLEKIWAGETGMSLPQPSDVPLRDPKGRLVENSPTMFVGAPVKNSSGKVISILAFRIDPFAEFTALFQRGRIGQTGETYAFNKSGRLISESRFDPHLRKIGLISPEGRGILNIEIRDPGVNLLNGISPKATRENQPLTRMARSAVSGKAGIDLTGYRDYRGVPVIGAWLWDSDLNIGITVEIDVEEVDGRQFNTRTALVVFALLTVITLIMMMVLFESNRKHLSNAIDAAESANRAKSAFISSMSHELRTPLNAIIGFSEMIKSQALGPVGSVRYQEYASDINNSGMHLLAIVNDILDISKLESGELSLYEEEFDVGSLVGESIDMVKRQAELGGIRLLVGAPESSPRLYADQRILKQALVNLLINAIKFTAKGGDVTLKYWSEDDGGFFVSIADSGIGMAAEDIPKALAVFSQVDNSLNRNHEGTGLGLPLSKSFVEMHGGSMELRSEVDVGTTVTIRLPPGRLRNEMPLMKTASTQ